MRRPADRHRPAAGFTLVEVLVALFIMATMAALAWRGVDTLVRSRDGAQGHSDRTLAVSNAIAQWEQDLGQLQSTPGVPALRFDGGALRLTRRSPDGLRLVVWTLQGDTLYRWSSPPLRRVSDLQDAWLRGQQWTGVRDQALAMLGGVGSWQVYFYRAGDNAWSNAQSSGNRPAVRPPGPAGSGPAGEDAADADNEDGSEDQLPVGVRLVLQLPEGKLTRDLMLQGEP